MIGVCPICTHTFPNLEEHHVIPREYGGIDKGTVFICGSCHQGLHSQANNMMSAAKKRYFFLGETLDRAMPYVNAIIQAALAWEGQENPSVKKKVYFSVKPVTLARLHKLKADHGFRSLDAFFEAMSERITKNL